MLVPPARSCGPCSMSVRTGSMPESGRADGWPRSARRYSGRRSRGRRPAPCCGRILALWLSFNAQAKLLRVALSAHLNPARLMQRWPVPRHVLSADAPAGPERHADNGPVSDLSARIGPSRGVPGAGPPNGAAVPASPAAGPVFASAMETLRLVAGLLALNRARDVDEAGRAAARHPGAEPAGCQRQPHRALHHWAHAGPALRRRGVAGRG